MKRLDIWPSYTCFPTWIVHEDGGMENINFCLLGLRDETLAELWQWHLDYQSTYNRDIPQDSGFKTAEEEEKSAKKCWQIFQKIKDELSDIYRVEYTDIFIKKADISY